MTDARDTPPGTSAVDLHASPPDAHDDQLRSTLADVERSIASALGPFAVDPNNEATWATAVTMVAGLLENLRKEGGLAGAAASEPFTVQCGIGSTMTPQDILDGWMIVQVTLQMLRPKEFIVLTIKQRMQGS